MNKERLTPQERLDRAVNRYSSKMSEARKKWRELRTALKERNADIAKTAEIKIPPSWRRRGPKIAGKGGSIVLWIVLVVVLVGVVLIATGVLGQSQQPRELLTPAAQKALKEMDEIERRERAAGFIPNRNTQHMRAAMRADLKKETK